MKKTEVNEIIIIVNNILEGKIGSIEASRKLIRLFYDNGLENDNNLLVFKALDSETDHLPFGRLRDNYSSQRLKEIDGEIKKYEDFYRDYIMNASKNILEKYSIEMDAE